MGHISAASPVQFLRIALRLKETPRRGWKNAGITDVESVAEHSFGCAVAAIILARERGLDSGRAAELALLHDLAEVETGDLLPGEVSPEEKRARERSARERLLALLPEASREHVDGLAREYGEQASPESRLVHELDKVEMALQAARYAERGTPASNLVKFRASADAGVKDPELRAILRELS